MRLEETLLEFKKALINENKEQVTAILSDTQWRDELETMDSVNKDILSEKCQADTQYAYEFLTLLKLLESPCVQLNSLEKKKNIEILKDKLHAIVDSANTDIDLYNLHFLSNFKSPKAKQSVLGKPKKAAKIYPNVPTSALVIMSPEFWDLDESVPYLDTAKGEKKELKVQSTQGRVTRGRHNEEMQGDYKYVVSPKGGLYAGKFGRGARKKHSSIRAGQPVISAGHMEVRNGRIIKIDPESGHYVPPAKQTLLACMILKDQNLIDDNCLVQLFGYKTTTFSAILKNDDYAKLVSECRKTLNEQREPNKEVINRLSFK